MTKNTRSKSYTPGDSLREIPRVHEKTPPPSEIKSE